MNIKNINKMSIAIIFTLILAILTVSVSASVFYQSSWDTAGSGNANPMGITMNTTHILVTDPVDDKVYKYYINGTYTSTSWDISGSGNEMPDGITMNDTYFWVTDYDDAEVYQYYINGVYTGTSWDTASSGNIIPRGITMNSTHFLITDPVSDKVYQYYVNGTYTGTAWDISAYGNTNSRGITMNSNYFWVTDINDAEVYQYYINGTYTGTSWDTSASGNNDPRGITMNTTHILITNDDNSEVYVYHNNFIPTVPVLVSPSFDSGEILTTISLNVSSTDANDDDITYYFYGGMSPDSMSFLGNNDSVDGSSYDWAISYLIYDTFYWTAYANDSYESSENMTTAQFYFIPIPNLILPVNLSTIYTTYPPLTDDISFTWSDNNSPQYRLLIAEDDTFNIITVDTHVGTNNTVQSLIVDKTYWWKVYSYDGVTYSNSSDVFNFTLIGNTTLTDSAIEGVVYAGADSLTPLSSAEVTIWNSTWSDTMLTGSNGYYVFTDLTIGEVYSVQAKKDSYRDSTIITFTAEADPVTRNMFLLVDLTGQEWWHYVKFTVVAQNGSLYPGTDVTVYIGESVTAHDSGTTGSDGSITFHMDRNIRYRITFINTVHDFSKEIYLYPISSQYNIIVSDVDNYLLGNFVYELITTNETITFSWEDPDGISNWINMTVTNSTGQVGSNYSTGASGIFTFYILNQSDTHCVNITVDTDDFGQLYLIECVLPPHEVSLGDVSDGFLNAFSAFILLIVAFLFGRNAVSVGVIMVAFTASLLVSMGWFPGMATGSLVVVWFFAIGVALLPRRS